MHPDALVKQLERDPFVPFRLHLTDGRTLEVFNPGLAYVTGTSLYVFEPLRRDSEGTVIANPEPRMISLRHIVSLEPITAAAA
jgi:hypothetical protein